MLVSFIYLPVVDCFVDVPDAVKYTNEGGITVRCSKAHEPEGLRDPSQVLVEIDVIDSGRGIAPQVLDTIFREFEQVEPDEPKKSSGEGVGPLASFL